MGDGHSDVVATFLELIEARKYGQATQELASLVDQVTGDHRGAGKFLFAEQEQKLQLKPTRAYKKLSKLLKHEDCIRSIWSILSEGGDNPDQMLLLDTICRLSAAPDASLQIASSSNVMDTLHELGPGLFALASASLCHTPFPSPSEHSALQGCHIYVRTLSNLLFYSNELVGLALSRDLLPLLFSLFPFPGEPPTEAEELRARYLSRISATMAVALISCLDTSPKAERFMQSGAVAMVFPWLTRFFDHLAGLLKLPIINKAEDEELRKSTKDLLLYLGEFCQTVKDTHPEFFKSDEFQSVVHSVQRMKPFLGDAGRGNAEAFLSLAERLLGNGGNIPTPLDAEGAFMALEALRLAGPNASDSLLDQAISGLLALHPDDIPVRLQSSLIEVFSGAFVILVKEAAKAGAEPLDNRARQRLWYIAFFLGTLIVSGASRNTVVAGDFDKVALQILGVLKPALGVLPANGHRFLFDILVVCFNEGSNTSFRVKLFTRAMVSINLNNLTQHAASLAWHLMAVLFGVWDQVDPEVVRDGALGKRFNFQSRQQTRCTTKVSSFLPVDDAKVVVLQALRVFEETSDIPSESQDLVQAAAEIVRLAMKEYPTILEPVLEQVGQITRLLEGIFEGLARNPSTKWLSVPKPLLALLEATFESCKSNAPSRKKFLDQTARNGGIEVCREVMKAARVAKSTSSSAEGSADPSGGDLGKSFAGEIWAAYAVQFGLKECGNQSCADGVVEVREKTFRACSACGTVQYCSRACQLVHWKNGHKAECKRAG